MRGKTGRKAGTTTTRLIIKSSGKNRVTAVAKASIYVATTTRQDGASEKADTSAITAGKVRFQPLFKCRGVKEKGGGVLVHYRQHLADNLVP